MAAPGYGSGGTGSGGGRRLVRLGRLDDNRGSQLAFEGQFGLLDSDDCRRGVLKHGHPFTFTEPVGSQLLPAGRRKRVPAVQPRFPPDRNVCQGSPRVPSSSPMAPTSATQPAAQETAHRGTLGIDPGVAAVGAAQHAAVRSDRAAAAARCRSPVDGRATHRAVGRTRLHADHPAAVRRMRTAPPTRNAMGKTTASIARAVRQPRSRAIIMTAAMHGMKRVMVTIATTT